MPGYPENPDNFKSLNTLDAARYCRYIIKIMIKVEKKDFGIKLTFASPTDLNETLEFKRQFIEALADLPSEFCVYADMRELVLYPANCKDILHEVQILAREKGLKRSVIVLNDELATLQLQLIANKTGIRQWERYIDASEHSNWDELAMNWILHAIEPDANVRKEQPTSK
jgi:hypothetical protein